MKYGVWGGRAPGGWCPIFSVDGADLSSAYLGTQEQAEKQAAELRRDYPNHTYTVDAFDPAREPAAVDGKPTAAQRRGLEQLRRIIASKYSDNAWYRQVARSTATALRDRGWIFSRIIDDGAETRLVVTAAGQRALERT